MLDTELAFARGKVRDLYTVGDESLLLVASDRISVFDVVLPTPIPDKGRVLTGLSAFWFSRTREIVPNHMLGVRADGRSLECRRLTMLPLECIVRGYLAGSGWAAYRAGELVSGHELPPGLVEAERLPEPLFTPSTKAASGHDEAIDGEQASALVGEDVLAEVERVSLELYGFAAAWTEARGVLLADTKLEFGVDGDGTLVLGDEAFTPDSSRFWPADAYAPGRPQPSYDKQFARDYCDALAWDKTAPGPPLPDDVVTGTRRRYIEAFERITGETFERYVADPTAVIA
jgi:phosphoribosylaminoimidazole-succinocarboxamide synthase